MFLSTIGSTRLWYTSTALAGSVPSGQVGDLAQSAAKSSNAFWKAAACRMSASTGSALGSTAPSRIIARTFCGKALGVRPPRSGCRTSSRGRSACCHPTPRDGVEIAAPHCRFRRWRGSPCPSCRRSGRRSPWSPSRCAPRLPGCSPTCGSARSRSLSASELHQHRRPRGGHAARVEADEVEAFADSVGNDCTSAAAASTPDSPGPPGLTMSEPIFSPVALKRIIASCRVTAVGLGVIDRHREHSALGAAGQLRRSAVAAGHLARPPLDRLARPWARPSRRDR